MSGKIWWDLDGSGAGTYIVSYTTTGTCPSTETFLLDIGVTQDATISAAGPFCTNDADLNLSAVDAGGTWSGTGITDVNSGLFDPATFNYICEERFCDNCIMMHVAIQMHRKQKINTCPHCDTRKEIPQAYVEHLLRGPLYYINQNLNKLKDLQGKI